MSWGWSMSCLRAVLACVWFTAICVCGLGAVSPAQISHSEQVQIRPPLMRTVEPPAPDATVADLEERADQLRASKLYLDAMDYYRAAMAKEANAARLLNK